MNNKIVTTKKTSAIFLAIVLVTGTIAAISPSFMKGAQAQPYYGYNSYEPDYGKDNDRKSYGKDSYESQYQSSYIPDYKPKYASYGKDNYKSTKDSSSVSLNKIKCINTNLNINGDNAGNVSIGNKGQVAEEGYLGAYSSGGGYDGERYYDGYDNNKKDKGFDCIINNNNSNVVTGAGGGNVTDQCAIDVEACFAQFLNATEFQLLTNALNNGITVQIGQNTVTLNSFADICDVLEGQDLTFQGLLVFIGDILRQLGILTFSRGLPDCLAEVFGIPIPTLAPGSVTSELDVATILQLR